MHIILKEMDKKQADEHINIHHFKSVSVEGFQKDKIVPSYDKSQQSRTTNHLTHDMTFRALRWASV